MPASVLAQPAPAGVSTDELESLVRTLENDKSRAEFVRTLKTIIEAQRAAGGEAAVSDNWLARFSGQLRAAVSGVTALGSGIDIPRFARWLHERTNDPASRERGFENLVKIAVIRRCFR